MTKMTKAEREECKRLIAERDELRAILSEFGATLSGWDPGVTAYLPSKRGDGWMGESLTFDGIEWSWLKPLLEELRDWRKAFGRAKA